MGRRISCTLYKIYAWSVGVLQAWPEGMDAFSVLQFLEVVCQDVWPFTDDEHP